MQSVRWEEIQTVFHTVADLPEAERASAVKLACGDDASLMAEVVALLEADVPANSILDRGLCDLAHHALDTHLDGRYFEELGIYEIIDLLGEGGMGVVYLARRRDLGSLVAVKLLRDAWFSPARKERFVQEQKTLAQLNHPGIARLYDAGILKEGTPWFVMEYVKGVPLTQYCRDHQCTIAETLRVFRAVCEAVQHAHGQAFIHLDLKPSNILVKDDGTIKLLDFGIAKQLEGACQPADKSRTLLRLMTPEYAAPEQIRGEHMGVYTDIYSLGVILYELLAGRHPYASSKPEAEANQPTVRSAPAKPSATSSSRNAINRSNWNDLDVLCLTAMHHDVTHRYQSAEALIRDIDHYQRDQPLEARPDSLTYTAGKFLRRNRRTLVAASLVLTCVAALIVFFLIRLTQARNAAQAETARTLRVERFMLNLFEGGQQEAGPAENLRVVELLNRGVQEARTLNQDPKVKATLYATLGGIYKNLGKFDQADSLLHAALDQQRSISGPNSPETAEDLVALGLLRSVQGNHKEAESLIREALAIDRVHPTRDGLGLANATSALGEEMEGAGSYDQAIPVLDDAVRLHSASGGDQAELARSLTSLAEVHFNLGGYAVAESLNQRALAIEQTVYGEQHPSVAGSLINLGNIQQQLGHYAEAERYFRQALDTTRAWYGNDNPATASAMTTLAQTMVFERRFDEAEGLLQQALAIQEVAYGKAHAHVAFVVNAMGLVALQKGNFKEAEFDFSRVVQIYRSFYGDRSFYVGLATSNLGSVYLQRKQYAGAERLFRDALQRYSGVLSADDLNVGIVHVKLGRALLRERRYREAEKEAIAGLEILSKQTSPSVSWARAARNDLALVYQALGEHEKEKKVRAELVALH